MGHPSNEWLEEATEQEIREYEEWLEEMSHTDDEETMGMVFR